MEIKYRLIVEESLMIQKFSGIFSIEVYMNYTRRISEKFSTHPVKKVLNDFRDLIITETDGKISDDYQTTVDRITNFRKNIDKEKFKNHEVALVLWVDKPMPTLAAHLFISNFPNKNFHYCSSVDHIMRILELPEKYKNLEAIMKNLEKFV